ncbi:hypothetical protein DBY21_02740 [Candidatus Gastranaerophilales bacterium]|nr:MAG: hypothetical protein DBY21_02740 [Candidatus Gastranaerophilales bacterium]
MQDRIKFRIWNKLANIMTYNFCFGNFGQEKEGMRKYDWCAVNYEPEFICFKESAFEHLEIMQCTGLRDKNGKLIFEGDIVKSSTTYWNGEVYSHNGLVCWDRTKWQIGVMKYERTKSRQNKRYDRALDFARFVSFQDNTPLKKFANVEVIGNIYENPELLEDGNANIQR